ncbi:MAG: tRNA (adenosine(37)-N6)-threonylcarbamoyltransferase complex ATPase subunit type 1 TsaE [Verrucomicrobiota bacterium]
MRSGSTNLLDALKMGVSTYSAAETEKVAQEIACELPPNCTVALHGDLGVGKTTFIRGLARAWKIEEPVTSPTYNLYTIYKGLRNLIHLDAYRLESEGDLEALMIEDFLEAPWCLAVEWPQRIITSIPSEAWHFYMEIEPANKSHKIRLNF